MEFYTLLRAFADSWALLVMFVVFVAAIVWVFRPGARQAYDDASQVPFRNDDRPLSPALASGTAEAPVKETRK